jgi:hypothetical protein
MSWMLGVCLLCKKLSSMSAFSLLPDRDRFASTDRVFDIGNKKKV